MSVFRFKLSFLDKDIELILIEKTISIYIMRCIDPTFIGKYRRTAPKIKHNGQYRDRQSDMIN